MLMGEFKQVDKDRILVEMVLKEFLHLFNSIPEIVVSAPGRIDFLNTHQDYKGLPVVSVGIDLRMYAGVRRRSDEKACIVSLNMLDEGVDYIDVFSVDDIELIKSKWFGNYLRASVKALLDEGYRVDGFSYVVYSNIPMGSGLGSSAALTITLIYALNELFRLGLSKRGVAELAYRAEHDIMGIPCGRLDQYGVVYGGIAEIHTRPPYNVIELPWINGVFVVIDSGIRHSTADIHPKRQYELNTALKMLAKKNLPEDLGEKIGRDYYSTLWGRISFQEIVPYVRDLPSPYKERILFTIKMNESTEIALKIIRGEIPSYQELVSVLGREWAREVEKALSSEDIVLNLIGLIMNYQHYLLRDYYDLSLPILERIRNSALKAGALGVKISGAGLGGSLVALAENKNIAKNIVKEVLENGASNAYIVGIDEGIRLENV